MYYNYNIERVDNGWILDAIAMDSEFPLDQNYTEVYQNLADVFIRIDKLSGSNALESMGVSIKNTRVILHDAKGS